LTGIGLHL